jgi:hypothetical protein
MSNNSKQCHETLILVSAIVSVMACVYFTWKRVDPVNNVPVPVNNVPVPVNDPFWIYKLWNNKYYEVLPSGDVHQIDIHEYLQRKEVVDYLHRTPCIQYQHNVEKVDNDSDDVDESDSDDSDSDSDSDDSDSDAE